MPVLAGHASPFGRKASSDGWWNWSGFPQSKATLCEDRCPGLGKQNLLSQEVLRGALEAGSRGDLDLNAEAGWLWGHALIFLWAPSPSLVWASHAQAVGVFSRPAPAMPSGQVLRRARRPALRKHHQLSLLRGAQLRGSLGSFAGLNGRSGCINNSI